jgi:DNA-directed RNA polymerase specialized sigma24 family protein
MTEEQIADEAMGLIQKGGKHAEQGAGLLCRHLTKRVQRYFERHRVPEAQAEELVTEVWLKLLTSQFEGRTRAIVWLWTVAGSVLLDWVAKTKAESRVGADASRPVEVAVDEDTWGLISESVAATHTPPWLKLCLERAAFVFEKEEPRRAEVLRFSCEKWSAEEIALYYGATPPVTAKQQTAARNRVLDAVKRARSYFAHCKD